MTTVLIVAVTGPVGSGKSTTMLSMARELVAQGRVVRGFVAIARARSDARSGANEYRLLWLDTGEERPYAARSAAGVPPYLFDGGVESVALEEARALPDESSAIVFFDEFGKREAEGVGLRATIEAVLSKKPATVVIGVREGFIDSLPKAPHVVLAAGDTGACAKGLDAIGSVPDWIRVGRMGAASGAFEFSVGSALHAVKFPLVGLAMSSAQTALMTWTANGLNAKDRVGWVAVVSAGLKALSPAGSKIGPMLAITVQGFLYSASIRLVGWNAVGVAAGSGIAGIWAASQGILLQWLLLGGALLKAYDAVAKWLRDAVGLSAPGVWTVVVILVLLHGLVGASVGLWVWRRRATPPDWLERFQSVPIPGYAKESWLQSLGRAFAGLLRPAFLIPVILVTGVLALNGTPLQEWVWIALRAIAIGWLVFALARRIDFRTLVVRLRKKGHWGPALAFDRALPETEPK